MTLLIIITAIVLFALSANFVPKYIKIFTAASFIIIFSFYYFLSRNMSYPGLFYPNEQVMLIFPMGNYYNLLAQSFQKKQLNIDYGSSFTEFVESEHPHESYASMAFLDKKYLKIMDLSLYKKKLYMYFGVVPVLLFYLPFNSITHYFLTDKIVVFFLSCAALFLAVMLLRRVSDMFNLSVPPYFKILSIFLIGIGNRFIFLANTSFTYEVAIICALFFMLLALHSALTIISQKRSKPLLFILPGLFLSLSTGTRAFYCLLIPAFFALLMYNEFKKNTPIKQIAVKAYFFIIPCLIFGFFLGAYNYLRFDSVFEFGLMYQLNDMAYYKWALHFKDIIKGLLDNLFLLPEISGSFPFFNLTKAYGNRLGNGFSAGIIFSFPMIISFLLLPGFFKYYKNNKQALSFLCLIIFSAVINLFVISAAGVANRYVCEYIYLLIIVSLVFFYYAYSAFPKQQKAAGIVFCVMTMFTLYINISMLFLKNFASYNFYNADLYHKLVKFLS